MQAHKNIICTWCGCTCDDIEVNVENNLVVSSKYSCAISAEKLLNCQKERTLDPMIRTNGNLVKVNLNEAVNRAAEILTEAKYPLFYGWSNTSCETIKVGLELVETLGGLIDNTSSVCHGPGMEAVQEMGEVSCSLGQIRHRADLIIYWGCNPTQAHPRHMPRYVLSKGRFKQTRKDRKIIVVDTRRTTTAKIADKFIQPISGKDYDLITALRMAIKDENFETEEVAGVPVEEIEELADIMASCEHGIIFFGLGLTMSTGKCENIAAALSLIRDLNLKTKFSIMPMRGHHNVTGANKVFSWQTGYPFGVDFSHGYPRYNPGETTSIDVLSRGECDAAFVVASDPVAHFPQSAVRSLSKIPVIVVDPSFNATCILADTVFPSAYLGIESSGSIYRMDGVPLFARKFVDPPPNCLPDTVILQQILKKVKELKGI
ncbi:MAG: formylmethanofuran dehydrogenase subunit B [Candidatus Bathyarchaeota archaeon]